MRVRDQRSLPITWIPPPPERGRLQIMRAIEPVTLTLRDLDGLAPTHFLGELTKTPEGCMYLRERGLVADLAEVVRLHGREPEEEGVLRGVKSALWALVS